MSWSFAIPAGDVADFEANAASARTTYEAALEGNDYALDQIASGQLDEAIKLASELVASGVVGSGTVTASVSGHANPDHKPAKGYANETVTISVSCADTAPTA